MIGLPVQKAVSNKDLWIVIDQLNSKLKLNGFG